MAPWNVHRLHTHTHTRNQHRARCITYPTILMVSFLHRPHFPRKTMAWPQRFKSEVSKNWVFDIYRSGNPHFCPPLWSHFWPSWARALPLGSGLPSRSSYLSLREGAVSLGSLGSPPFFFTGLVCWYKSLQHLPFSISWSQFQCLPVFDHPEPFV